MTVWFFIWAAAAHGVAFAFYLRVTRGTYGWVRTVAAYVAFFLLPFAACLLFANPSLVIPPLQDGVPDSSGALAVGNMLFFGLWTVLALAMSRGVRGRRLFAVLCCGVHQVGAFILSLLFLHRLSAAWGGVLAVGTMAGMGLLFFLFGIPAVLKMDESADWRFLNLTAAMNLMLLFSTGCWPIYVPTGTWQDLVVFLLANFAAIAYFPVCHASAETNRMKRTIRMIQDNTRILQAELRSAQAAEEGARRVRHDTRHHNDVVREMLAAGRVKEAEEYLANVNRHELLSSLGRRRWCDNHLVNALLAVAERKAESRGLKLTATADVPAMLALDEADVTALVGNLLENAVLHGEPGEVRATLALDRRGILRLGVENAVRPGFALVNGLPTANEGVGLLSIRRVVEKCRGLMGYEVSAGRLICKVVIGCA